MPTIKKEGTVIKLLIVDDEILTRSGLSTSIDWISLGIDEVYQAQDGMEGYHMFMAHRPEIILSDVRMPRMNGIEMLEKVREIAPDTVFIFMSGFSDKEYLKAAIRLQAVNYVEKPLDIEEVTDAVRTAVSRCIAIEQSRNAESISNSISAEHLATCLTIPYRSARESVQDLSRQYCQKYGSADLFHSAFTLILQVDERTELTPDFFDALKSHVHDRIRPMHLHIIGTEKKTNLFVLHLFRKESFSETTILQVTACMEKWLYDRSITHWYITTGSIVSGIHKLYDSYSSAVITLQHSFFYPIGTTLLESTEFAPGSEENLTEIAEELARALRDSDEQQLHELAQTLFQVIDRNSSLLQKSIQTLYLQLITDIGEQRKQRQLTSADTLTGTAEVLDALNGCFSYEEMHAFFVQTVDSYLQDLKTRVPENSSVYLIKSYIQQHFDNPMLSTKEISEYASLSASYACTVFKNETGQTLNQYLTEYRLERAKELLADPRNNISEVSARVGYNDSNYFGKAFKKYSGFSPSEFRESRG